MAKIKLSAPSPPPAWNGAPEDGRKWRDDDFRGFLKINMKQYHKLKADMTKALEDATALGASFRSDEQRTRRDRAIASFRTDHPHLLAGWGRVKPQDWQDVLTTCLRELASKVGCENRRKNKVATREENNAQASGTCGPGPSSGSGCPSMQTARPPTPAVQPAPSSSTHQEPMLDVGGVMIKLWRPGANKESGWFMGYSISQYQWPRGRLSLKDMQFESFMSRAREAGFDEETEFIQWNWDGELMMISGLDDLSAAVYLHLTRGQAKALRLDIVAKETSQSGMFYTHNNALKGLVDMAIVAGEGR